MPAKKGTTGFLDLPLELRLRVYRYIVPKTLYVTIGLAEKNTFNGSCKAKLWWPEKTREYPRLNALDLALTCKKIRTELGDSSLKRSSTFDVDCARRWYLDAVTDVENWDFFPNGALSWQNVGSIHTWILDDCCYNKPYSGPNASPRSLKDSELSLWTRPIKLVHLLYVQGTSRELIQAIRTLASKIRWISKKNFSAGDRRKGRKTFLELGDSGFRNLSRGQQSLS